ncbi:TPA: glycerophosphodiester phosphodiesterase [Legionella pneumophila]|nr:glycerophosphodiester phosphodiesterase [Legionella pneumophila]HAU1577850.1 glycerophosphodiester phosphodiesterase [Legionella pneumophila]HAU1681637.1 glycerophosphodiester phosphodiesterase [Legionella pneumophila]HAU3700615.1 glycerophosphodiester phosphodiesterase [Legionella pneumophila]
MALLLKWIEKLIDGYFAVIPRQTPESENINSALVIAHRGAHNNARGIIENTLEAFQIAKEAGCWGIELDVHLTKDKVLVVNHDPTLNRLWNKDIAISDLSFSELRTLEFRIPSLSEVVQEYGNSMHLFIELKTALEEEEILVQTLQHLTPCKDFHLLTLQESTFKKLCCFPKQSLLLVAVHNNVKKFCELSIKEGYGGVLGNYLLLTNRVLKYLQDANQHFGVGFVDSKNSLYRELNRGVKWLFTNEAININQYLNDLKNRM